MSHFGFLAVVPALLVVVGCERAAPPDNASAETPVVMAQPAAPAVAEEDLGRACRAAIAALNGHQPSIIRVTKIEEGVVYTSYARPSDGKVWKNRCRFEGASITWAAVDLDGPNTGPGRWRDGPHDERMSYNLEGDNVTIRTTYEDGSGETNTYMVDR